MLTKKTPNFSNEHFGKSLKKGDLAAYEVLFERYYAKLCSFVFKLEQNRSLAEDIAQEAFAILWEKREQIDSNLSIQGYLFKICHNEFLKHARAKKKERAFLDEVKANLLYNSKVIEEVSDNRLDKLRQSIDELPPRCKEAFVLSKFEKLKYAEIAEQMGISVKTVEIHISKAFTILRNSVISILLIVQGLFY